MARSGRAIRVISDPKMEMVAAVQTRTNASLRQSGEAKGLRTDRGAYTGASTLRRRALGS